MGLTALVIKGSNFLYMRMSNSDPPINGRYSQLSPIPVTDKYFNSDLYMSNSQPLGDRSVLGAWAHIPPGDNFFHLWNIYYMI